MSKARILLPIEGMSCAACAATVQEALGGVAGVASATVNYATGKAAGGYDDGRTHVAELIQTVRSAGYDCGRARATVSLGPPHHHPRRPPLEQAPPRAAGG